MIFEFIFGRPAEEYLVFARLPGEKVYKRQSAMTAIDTGIGYIPQGVKDSFTSVESLSLAYKLEQTGREVEVINIRKDVYEPKLDYQGLFR